MNWSSDGHLRNSITTQTSHHATSFAVALAEKLEIQPLRRPSNRLRAHPQCVECIRERRRSGPRPQQTSGATVFRRPLRWKRSRARRNVPDPSRIAPREGANRSWKAHPGDAGSRGARRRPAFHHIISILPVWRTPSTNRRSTGRDSTTLPQGHCRGLHLPASATNHGHRQSAVRQFLQGATCVSTLGGTPTPVHPPPTANRDGRQRPRSAIPHP